MTKRTARRRLVTTGWFIAMALCFGSWPQQSSAVRATVSLADRNETWGNGRFFRTGLAAANFAGGGGGGIQLVPVKVQQTWPSTSELPKAISSHTSATYQDRIFVVGGNVIEDNGQFVKSSYVFATRVANVQSGALQPWTTLSPLRLPVSDAASVVVEVGGQPYLFALGGQRAIGTNKEDVTTARIQYYPIRTDASGNLIDSPWQEVDAAQQLPSLVSFGEGSGTARGGGASGISAVSLVVGGTPYIYIFGGYNRVFAANTFSDRYVSKVYRAEVMATSSGVALGPWTAIAGANGSINGGTNPVALAGAATVTFTDPSDNSTGVYLIGGTLCTNSCDDGPVIQQDSNAYIARIATNGDLTWLPNGNMSAPRSAHDAVQSKGRIMVGAGRSSDEPTPSLAQGFINDTPPLTLYQAAPGAPNFDLQQGALPGEQAIMNHSMEVMSGGIDGDTAYIIGGKVKVSQGSTADASKQVLYADMDAPPLQTDDFVANGKYYSKVYDFGANAEYFRLSWSTLMAEGEQITMQYRLGDDAQNLGPWLPATADTATGVGSVHGAANSLTLPANTKGRYFQFTATLSRSNSAIQHSPILDSVGIDVNRVGYPNIRFTSASSVGFSPNPVLFGNTAVPSVSITNKAFGNTAALDADWDAPGSFFVDLYVTPPGQPAQPPQIGQIGTAYYEVGKSSMKINNELSVPVSNWRPGDCSNNNCSAVNWRGIFSQPGTYTVYVMVDSLNNVKESDDVDPNVAATLGETDNVFGPYTVTVAVPDRSLYLPYASSQVAAPQGIAATADSTPQPRVHTLK